MGDDRQGALAVGSVPDGYGEHLDRDAPRRLSRTDIDLDERSAERWFNTAAFATAPDIRRGNATVGQIRGPHFYRWDLALRKNFRVSHYRLEFRADAFNVFNRVNYNNPQTVVTNSNFGTITTAKTPREFQFGLRFEF